MILLTVTNFVTVVVFTWIAFLCFFWLPASWFNPDLTLFFSPNRFKHHEADENPSSPPSLAQSHAYSIDCGGVPFSLLSQAFPLLLPVQALWRISRAPKTRLLKTPTLSPTACLQLHLPVKLHCNPSVTPWPNTPTIRLAWSWAAHPCAEERRPCRSVTRNAKVTVKHPNRSHQRTSSPALSPWLRAWHCRARALLLSQALQEASLEPELAPHGSGKNMLLILKSSCAFTNWSNKRFPMWSIYMDTWRAQGCSHPLLFWVGHFSLL